MKSCGGSSAVCVSDNGGLGDKRAMLCFFSVAAGRVLAAAIFSSRYQWCKVS